MTESIAAVIAFPAGDPESMAWQALSIANAARAADRACAQAAAGSARMIDLGRAEARLAADVAEMSAILEGLAQQVAALREYYN